ncbi:CRISPR-associated protein Cas5 [bacterium]|nr:CRISPR-associated protein Cas5 [bacterium]
MERRKDRQYSLLEVNIWGEFACFARPEMKVERVSYPVMILADI